jgi:hypothetical protein
VTEGGIVHRLFALFFLVAGSSVFAADPAPLHVEFEQRALTIHGVSPQADVLVFSIHRQQVTYQYSNASIWRLTGTEAKGGVVRVTTPDDIHPDRLWVIVDQATGRSIVTRRAGETAIARFPAGLARKEMDAKGDALVLPIRAGHLLVVRPGGGAWLTQVGDGGSQDDDGVANNSIRVRPEKLDDFRGKRQKNDEFGKGDLVIAVELATMRVMEERLK